MDPRAASSHVVLASGNRGKLEELSCVLAPLALELVPQAEFEAPDIEETGLTFVENAILKARAASAHCELPAIADDSGLEVDHLGGAPGIYSARYSGQGDVANNEKLLQALRGVPAAERTARFQCVLVYLRHATDPSPLICQAQWEGVILETQQGQGGFGYDPLFYVPDQQRTAAELPAAVKNRISHRAQASALLYEALRAH
ncbi:MAG: RdgB/HAM1 family non-canonical purine NTP pyrophosphatase [Pseudomonadota bacterium]